MPPLLPETASQTAGPFLHLAFDPPRTGLALPPGAPRPVLAGAHTPGERIHLEGRVLDGGGMPVTDAVLELWQADSGGRYPSGETGTFTGFGRTSTDSATGAWRFETVKPGPVSGPDGSPMAPHVTILVFARGLSLHLHTRVYFDDETALNHRDPVLARVPGARRTTLIARRDDTGVIPVYRWDVVLQGAGETVVFAA